jgi:hypothetical protein
MVIEEIRSIKSTKRSLREFAITMCLLLGVLGVVFLLRKKEIHLYFFIISGFFLFLGILLPGLLRPIYKIWMSISVLIAWLMTKLILSILFYFVITPLGLCIRLCGKKFLDVKFTKDTESYWVSRKETPFDKRSYERQF